MKEAELLHVKLGWGLLEPGAPGREQQQVSDQSWL